MPRVSIDIDARELASEPAVSGGADSLVRRAPVEFGFDRWEPLLAASLAASRFVEEAGIPRLEGASPQRNASAFEAAFSVDLRRWPLVCRRFLRRWTDRFASLYALRDAGGVELSFSRDLARRSAFVSMRNGLRWHAQWRRQGADPQFQWCAFELTNLASEIRRHCDGLEVDLPSLDLGRTDRTGRESDAVHERLRHWRRVTLRRAMNELDLDTQRVLRMCFGFFPCTNRCSVSRIAGILGVEVKQVQDTLARGMDTLRGGLDSRPGDGLRIDRGQPGVPSRRGITIVRDRRRLGLTKVEL